MGLTGMTVGKWRKRYRELSLAQPGGALVWAHHLAAIRRGSFSSIKGADRQNRAVRGCLQQDQGAVQLDGDGGFNPGENPATLLANLRDGALGTG